MLANMYVVEPRLFYLHRRGRSLRVCRASRGAIMPCGVSKRIETFFLHLSRIITAEKSTRAFTCMHVASRVAGSPNPASCMPTIVTMALENRPIFDGTGSALCCKIVSDRSVCNHVTAEGDDAKSGERRMGTAMPG